MKTLNADNKMKIKLNSIRLTAERLSLRPWSALLITALLVSFANAAPPDAGSGTHREREIKGVPPRDAATKKNLIDLSDHFNGSIRQGWFPSTGNGSSADKTLPIPLGIERFNGIDFDLRGGVQLSGILMKKAGGQFPEEVKGIKVGLNGERLHFLQAAGWAADAYVPLRSKTGVFVVHYGYGSEREVPIVTGEDLRDWVQHDENIILHGEVAWKGETPNGLPARVFHSHWENPQPDVEISSLDYVSKMTAASPFLIAITAE